MLHFEHHFARASEGRATMPPTNAPFSSLFSAQAVKIKKQIYYLDLSVHGKPPAQRFTG
jgi:hypothetical protein